MFHSRILSNRINRLHERALRIVYSDYKSSYCELLEKDKSFSIHWPSKFTSFYIIYHLELSITHLKSINCPYDLRKRDFFQSRNPSSVRYGTEAISYIAPLVPETIKSCYSLKSFKQKIRKWKPDSLCRLCKVYLQHVGFI